MHGNGYNFVPSLLKSQDFIINKGCGEGWDFRGQIGDTVLSFYNLRPPVLIDRRFQRELATL